MLGGHDDRRRLYRLATLILQRYLAFRVRAEAGIRIGMAGLGQRSQNFMRIENRSWHKNRGFSARIPEHDALIAGTLIFVADSIHALSDIDRLLMQMHFYFSVFPVKAVLLVADISHGIARNPLDLVHGNRVRTANLTGYHDTVGSGQRLACNSESRVFRQI